MTIYDQDTGEVIIYDPEVALQTDAQIIAVSEHALMVTFDLLNSGIEIDGTQEVRAQTKALDAILASRVRSRDARLEASNNLAEARLRIERHTGQRIPVLQAAGVLAARGGDIANYHQGSLLSDYQISHKQSSIWQKIGRVPDDVFEEYIASCKEDGIEISTAGLLKFAKSQSPWLSSESNEWYTPSRYIEAARAVMGSIDVDPASNDTAQEVIQAGAYYTAETNGLNKDWPGRVWLNPPYGGLSAPFVERLINQFNSGITTEAVVLVNANSTETNWFSPLWDYVLCFCDHRINFETPGGADNGSTHGSVFIYLGGNKHKFYENFNQFGYVVVRYA